MIQVLGDWYVWSAERKQVPTDVRRYEELQICSPDEVKYSTKTVKVTKLGVDELPVALERHRSAAKSGHP